jgi:SAM-dependent methyltransferase
MFSKIDSTVIYLQEDERNAIFGRGKKSGGFVQKFFSDLDLELEVRIGKFHDGRFESSVSYEDFSRFYTTLDSANIEKKTEQSLDVTFEDKDLSIDGNPIRVSVIGTDAIMGYCEKNVFPSDRKSIQFGYKGSKERVDLTNHDMRVSLAKDVTMSRLQFRDVTGLDVEEFSKKVSSVPKYFRYKCRYSFYDDLNQCRVDLTMVKAARGISLSTSGALSEQPVYEVEIEFERSSETDFIDLHLEQWLGKAMQIRQSTYLPIDHKMTDTVLKEFFTVVMGSDGVRRAFDNYDRSEFAKVFPGSKVVSMEHAHLTRQKGKPYIYENYSVTDKADGERNLLYIARDGKVYLINDRMRIMRTEAYIGTSYADTIIDGELVYSKENYFYYAFDILFHNGRNVTDLPFYTKSSKEECRHRLLLDAEKTLTSGTFYRKTNLPYVSYSVKKYFFVEKEDVKTMQRYCSNIWSNRDNMRYHLDGLIFTPNGDKYPMFKTWPSLLKWKPVEDNSIDFLIRTKEDGRIITRVTKDETGKETPRRYSVASLYVGDMKGREYVPVRFDIPNTLSKEKSYEILLPIDEKGVAFGRMDGVYIRNDTIVECVWDYNFGGWCVIRTRLDKTERYNKSGRNITATANNLNVAVSIWATIVNPITEGMIIGTEKPVPAAETYYTQVGTDLTRPLRGFHNYIKSKLLQGARAAGDSLLDLSCGRGGDINKWKHSGYNRIVGLDFSREGIESTDPSMGITGRFMQMKKKADSWAQNVNLHFFWADTSKLVTSAYPNGICADANKAEVKQLLAKPFDTVVSFFSAHYYFENNMKIRGFLQNIYDNLRVGGYAIITCSDAVDIHDRILGKIKKDAVRSGIVDNQTVWEIKKGYTKTVPLVGDKSSVGIPIGIKFESISENFIQEWLVHSEYLLKLCADYGLKLVSDDESKRQFGMREPTGLFSSVLSDIEDNLDVLKQDELGNVYFNDIENMLEHKNYSLREWSGTNRYYILKKEAIKETIPNTWRGQLKDYDCSKQYSKKNEEQSPSVVESSEAVAIAAPISNVLPTPAVVEEPTSISTEVAAVPKEKKKRSKITTAVELKQAVVEAEPSQTGEPVLLEVQKGVLAEPEKKKRTSKKNVVPAIEEPSVATTTPATTITEPPKEEDVVIVKKKVSKAKKNVVPAAEEASVVTSLTVPVSVEPPKEEEVVIVKKKVSKSKKNVVPATEESVATATTLEPSKEEEVVIIKKKVSKSKKNVVAEN